MKKQLLIGCFFTAFLLISPVVNAQSVKGKVVDAITGSPISNASVYLKGLSKGTISNAQGEFTLNTGESTIPLIISYVGYQSDTINNYNGKTLAVKLSPRNQVLREVVIGDKSRAKYMKIFITQFIGSRDEDCTIVNPEVIKFTYNRKTRTLAANASQPLIIHNKKLGYNITCFLSAFSYLRSSTPKKTSYKGDYFFAEDTLALPPDEIKTILKARDKAYYGSRMHFLRSVWANDLKGNNFFYGYANTNFAFNNIRANREQLLSDTSTINLVKGINHFLEFPCMIIKYNGGNESHLSFENGTKDLRLTPGSYNNSQLIWSGRMGGQRVSELLPVDFEPSEQLSNTSK
ncbi:carboxypeptidase-like regulatory domain-containing protein [Mucilaginibacter calamicampi]|uniref:Carboxypeptidase-like regulatory domain-containing protein n=1 Tax=Mucilaginibacter calamicampi TaxID=1302352 RepID=A0ABW2Z0D1_9SPHI